MLEPLICGYGRAGRRHEKLLINQTIFPSIVDTDSSVRPHFTSLHNALCYHWRFVVIASPPDVHLDQIRQCLDLDMFVLCEKPLCGWGQLEEARKLLTHPHADKLMMAFNYRYNPDIVHRDPNIRLPNVEIYSSQYRESLPSWGLLLDHVPHDLDILQWRYGDLVVETARVREDEKRHLVLVMGYFLGDGKTYFKIHDEVTKYPKDRQSYIIDSLGRSEISANPLMFTEMYRAFFAFMEGQVSILGLSDGIKIQEYLEKSKELSS